MGVALRFPRGIEARCSARTPTLKALLHEYEEGFTRHGCRRAGQSNCLTDGEGFMLVEDWQEGLKRITFRVIWEGDPDGRFCDPGALREFCQTAYLHRTSKLWAE